MPAPKGTRFRVRKIKGGKKQRLAIKDGDVIETKKLPKKRKKAKKQKA